MSASFRAWDRQENEKTIWYERFLVYLHLGPGRTVNEAFRETTPKKPGMPTVAPGSWREIARRWEWSERASAWDDHIRAEQRQQADDQARKDITDHLAMSAKLSREASITSSAAAHMITRCIEHIIRQTPERIEPGDLARLMAAMAKLSDVAVNLGAHAVGIEARDDATG